MKDLTLLQAEIIADTHFRIATLEPRNRDALDFHEVSVRAIYSALNAAYKAGQASVKRPKKKAVKKVGTPWSTGIWD